MKKLLISLITAGLLLVASSIFAANITFQWDANTEADLAGYKLYASRTSGNYAGANFNTIGLADLPDPANPEYTLHAVPMGTWYFVLTAFDNEVPENESGYSNEVMAIVTEVPGPPGDPQNFIIVVISP